MKSGVTSAFYLMFSVMMCLEVLADQTVYKTTENGVTCYSSQSFDFTNPQTVSLGTPAVASFPAINSQDLENYAQEFRLSLVDKQIKKNHACIKYYQNRISHTLNLLPEDNTPPTNQKKLNNRKTLMSRIDNQKLTELKLELNSQKVNILSSQTKLSYYKQLIKLKREQISDLVEERILLTQ